MAFEVVDRSDDTYTSNYTANRRPDRRKQEQILIRQVAFGLGAEVSPNPAIPGHQ